MRLFLASATVCAILTAPTPARAFCGFYVSGGGADLFNNATQVVLMRMGTRTVLSMQNNYQGPPADFAMVIPVPVVLQEDHVKTLDLSVLTRVDRLSAPRLVEYWEQDPCAPPMVEEPEPDEEVDTKTTGFDDDDDDDGDLGVTVEAEFKVGEYQVVILSTKESTGLETWLRQEQYNIPSGAAPLLRPYVQAGMKFFVAKVDTDKVRFEGGMAMLSPLRFHYDDSEFRLPIRLGLMNSSGTQDLIVHILAPSQRYELANYDNVTIPTNLNVKDGARTRFGEFYAALFDATVTRHPGAVVTEYAWDASTCDPCPEPPLDRSALTVLGADVLGGDSAQSAQPYHGNFVHTRLHARYDKNGVPDDLVFKAAPPLVGGRELRDGDGTLEHGARPGSYNTFQGRYAIRHAWTGPIACEQPIRGIWVGPPDNRQASPVEPALDLAFAPRGNTPLPAMIASDIPELGVTAGSGGAGNVWTTSSTSQTTRSGCGCRADSAQMSALTGALVIALLALLHGARRRRVRQRVDR